MSIQRVAVTGGNGRIGQATIENLNNHGYYTINVDIEPKYRTEAARQDADDVADECRTTDLLDAGEAYGSIARSDADAIIHMATISRPTTHPGFVTYESNVMSTYHLLEIANELGIESVCLPSSLNIIGSIYQQEPVEVEYLPVDEEHPLTPRDPYAIGKHCIEVTADGFARLNESPTTISSIRYPWVLYDEELREMLVEVDRSLKGLRNPPEFMADVNEYTTRDVMFSYIHIDDAAEIARLAIEADYAGHESFWAVADDTTAEVPSDTLVKEFYESIEVRKDFEDFEALITTDKAKLMLGWTPDKSWRDFT